MQVVEFVDSCKYNVGDIVRIKSGYAIIDDIKVTHYITTRETVFSFNIANNAVEKWISYKDILKKICHVPVGRSFNITVAKFSGRTDLAIGDQIYFKGKLARVMEMRYTFHRKTGIGYFEFRIDRYFGWVKRQELGERFIAKNLY